jgi:hypothetical protein
VRLDLNLIDLFRIFENLDSVIGVFNAPINRRFSIWIVSQTKPIHTRMKVSVGDGSSHVALPGAHSQLSLINACMMNMNPFNKAFTNGAVLENH